MNIVKFLCALILTGVFFGYVNFQQGEIPPLGYFLSPFTGFWVNGANERLNLPTVISSDQLNAEVTILFDEQIFPHIFADNVHDLYFAQGYITAMHRLWQMEFQVLAAAGRTTEIFGKKQLEFDRIQRRKGLVYGAKRSLETISSDSQTFNMIQAYTDGVNYWIDQLDMSQLPVEYKLLDYVPEPWTNLKALLMIKNMADLLSRGESDLENTNALALFGESEYNKLFPASYSDIDPVIPRGTRWQGDIIVAEKPAIEFPQSFTQKTIEKPDQRNGSNNFVIGKEKSISGNPILANEPDLSLNLPSIWYVLQLHAPSVNVMGASLPGMPGVMIGYNDSIAWGMTNAKRDVVDWYKINFKNDKRKEYQYDDKWLKTEIQIEEFIVRNDESYFDTIVYTHHGPVMYDRNFMGARSKNNFAMKWTAHDGSNDFKTIYQVNRANNFDQFFQAFQYYSSPPQNFAFASVNGDIAMSVQGKFPVKWEGQGKFLLDGADSRQEWQSYIPYEQNATVLNPLQGFVSSANQHPVDATYPYYVYDYHYEFYRNRRINDRLKSLKNISVDDMIRLQNDNYNYRASESLPIMLNLLDSAPISEKGRLAVELLRKWNYFNEANWVAPTIYQLWWDAFYHKVWDEMDQLEVSVNKPHIYNTIHLMRTDPESVYFDNATTPHKESLANLLSQSFNMAMDSLIAWEKDNGTEYEWYLFKNTRIQHLLGLNPFSRENVEIGGYDNIVNAASGRHGPSWRMVVELADNGIKGWGVYPGSQSGNPGNPLYGHMIDNWANGIYYPLVFLHTKDEKNDKIIFTQTIIPSK